MSNTERPIALDAYEALAEGYAQKAQTKAENGFNEHPAIRAVIGDVGGLRALDAGCGPGFMLAYLAENGAAEIIGVDISPRMINLARRRIDAGGDRSGASLYVADLAQPMPFLQDAHFDLVTSSLAIDYVCDWSAPFGEFARILKPGGRLVFSVQHPMASYAWLKPPSPFGVHYCEVVWRGFTTTPVTVPDYYRSFDEIINPVIKAGFRLAGVTETKPAPALRDIDPYKFERGMQAPTFMVIDAVLA